MSSGAGGQRSTARRFVALPVPAEIRERLASALPRDPDLVDGLRWTRPEGWHLTVAFLGPVEDVRFDDVVAAVQAGIGLVPLPPARLEVGDVARFGRRVLWAGVRSEPDGWLADVARPIRAMLRDNGFPVDDKPMRPHLTLARAGRRPVTQAVVGSCALPDLDRVTALRWTPNAVELWRSELGHGPARYTSEATIPLAPERTPDRHS